jgi:tetratricopeptide (TPR) repeat protein
MLMHVLSIDGHTATADGVTWTVDPDALTAATGEDLFEALFPAGPGRDWYEELDPDAALFIDADEALADVGWESICDDEGFLAATRGVAEVVKGSDAATLVNLGLAYESVLCFDEAFAVFDEARVLFEEQEDRPGELLALQCLARSLSMIGDDEEAEAYLDEALDLAQELGDRTAEGFVLNALAQVYAESERWDDAEVTYEEALECMREVGEREPEAGILNNLAMLYSELERWTEARATYEHALGIYEELGAPAAMVPVMCNLATLWQAMGEQSTALESLSRAMAIGRESGADGVLTVISHALQMGSEAADDNDWDFLLRMAQALSEEVGPVPEEAPEEEDVDDMVMASTIAQVALGMMFTVGQARGDQSHPAIVSTAEQLRIFDDMSGGLLELAGWLEAACDEPNGGLRFV